MLHVVCVCAPYACVPVSPVPFLAQLCGDKEAMQAWAQAHVEHVDCLHVLTAISVGCLPWNSVRLGGLHESWCVFLIPALLMAM